METVQKMDKLDVIFDMQDKLNAFIRESRGLEFSSQEWIQKQTLAMLSEMAELIAEVNFKWWKNPKEINERAVKEEIVDILHFLVSMALSAGMSAKEMFEIYLDKNEENFKRQFGTSAKHGYELSENK